MPRQARKKSRTGIYHIMIRGINRQTIFETDEDYIKFIDTMQKSKEKRSCQAVVGKRHLIFISYG